MASRLLSSLVVLFWALTTAWLARDTWRQDEGRYDPVDPEEALGAFFRWNETANLVILENGVRAGQMVLGGFEGEDPRDGRFTRGITTQGSLEGAPGAGESLAGASWRLTAEFADPAEPRGLEASLRLPAQGLNLRLELAGDPPRLSARAMMGGTTVLETGNFSSREESDPPGGLPLVPGWLPAGGPESDLSGWLPRIDAARGTMEVAGSDQPVYLVRLRFGEGEDAPALKLYLSEAGEPWRLDTGWGFEALADVLAPVELPRR